jgi:tetratricopeptide (TPR) repeat protein
MAAINSHVVLQIAKDCARHQPDLFIVYLGNNEVTGPYGAGTVFTPLSGSLSIIRLGIALKATKLGQLLTSLFESAHGEGDKLAVWRGMQMFLEKQIRADDPGLETVYQHFRKNLEDIKRVAHKRGAKIIFCTVGSNLKDCPPFASSHRPDLTDTENKKWDDIYKRATELETAGNYAKAAEYYLAAAEIDDSYADLQFRLGHCYRAMGEHDKARDRYIKARELDTLRFRADNRINATIRQVATGKTEKSLHLVDVVDVLQENSLHTTAGEELFYEHVHLNFGGSYLLAKTIVEQVHRILPEEMKSQKATNRPLLSEAECAERLAYTNWDRYRIADQVLNEFIKKPPFTNQLYHNEEVKLMDQELKNLRVYLDPEALKESAAQYRRAIENDRSDWRLHYKYGRLLAEDLKDYKAAAKEYRSVQTLLPHCHLGYDALGSVLRGLGDLDAAVSQYLKAIQIRPTSADPHYYVGWVYQKQGNTDKAVEYYSKTVQLRPDYVPAYNNLAEILNAQGKIDEAVQICRRGLHFAPNNAILHGNLGILLNKLGRRDESLKELDIALELDPNSTKIRKVRQAILKNRTN